MANAIFEVPVAENEPVKSYAPDSEETQLQKTALKDLKSKPIEIPMYIGSEEVTTGDLRSIHPPHEHGFTLGQYHYGNENHVNQAIEAALAAKPAWENMPWQDRAAIFLKAAELLAGPYRPILNGATMLCQSKNAYQAEIDAACELIDFWRFNVEFMNEIYTEQPQSAPGFWNRTEYRPLEGFCFAISPFNFTAIAGNLCSSMAMMGNTVVWKCADSAVYSAHFIMQILKQAGLPDGVINLIYVDGPVAGDIIFKHPQFAGLHFTGSTGVFNHLWKTIGDNLSNYKSYPRIVGETGGKDFVVAHASADPTVTAVALARGAFEYQGQKCSAASRAYIPSNIWSAIKEKLLADVASFKMGTTEDFGNFINAVIDETAFDKIAAYIEGAKKADDAEIICGGTCDKSVGYFIEPTIILAKDPKYKTMCEEIFGPVLTIYVYDENDFEATLDIVNETSAYALTGSIISTDRQAILLAHHKLKHAAGNFYINDKPTGAVVGQQPFGGARGSGTNDKAGSKLNLLRWVSAQTIKETFNPPTDYRYPFLG